MADNFPLLTALLLWPATAAALLWLLPERVVPRFALGTAMVETLLALTTLTVQGPGYHWVEKLAWIPTLNIHYHLGVDGISLLFLPLTALLFIGVILASWTTIREMVPLYFALLLLLEAITMAIFCAMDTILFFLFWESSLIPLYFLIALWGVGPRRRLAATKYTLMMLAGGVLLLLGFVLTALSQFHNGNPLLFDLPTLLNNPLPPAAQTPVFLLLLAGFAIKVPVVPLHTWLPLLAMEGPVGLIAFMTGLKLGAYGLIRFAIPLAPQAAQEWNWILTGLAVIGVLYGGLAALFQSNLRQLLAFSSISHVGLVLLGIASLTHHGWHGAIFQLLNFSLASGGIFLMAGFVHHRLGSTDVIHLGGLAKSMPLASGFFFFLGLAGMGMPLTASFPAELLLFTGAFQAHLGSALAALAGQILAAAYFLSFFRRAFLGPIHAPAVQQAMDLRPRELALVLLFSLPLLLAGFFPSLVLDRITVAIDHSLTLVTILPSP